MWLIMTVGEASYVIDFKAVENNHLREVASH